MPRIISPGLQTEFNKSVTGVGYLLQWNGSQIVRWSNIGTLTYLGFPWVGYDFTVEGLRFDPEQEPTATIRAQNLDNAAAAFFQFEATADVIVDIYQVATSALADGDAAKLVRLCVDSCEIGLQTVDVKLVSIASQYAFSPRRRVDFLNGFSYAMPPGSQIAWGNEIFIAEEASSG